MKIWRRSLAKSPKIIKRVGSPGLVMGSMSPRVKFRLLTVYAAAMSTMW